MIWLIGGTTEGKEIAEQLIKKKQQVIISVVSEQGKDTLTHLPCLIHVGAMNRTEMSIFAIEQGIELILDASHPYAQNVSENALLVANNLGLPFVRYERKNQHHPTAIYVKSYIDAVTFLATAEGNILLTTGSRMLQQFATLERERLYARVMPTQESIAACEAANIPMSHILAINGLMSAELNYQILQEYNIGSIVSKDSGQAGGLPEKVAAAQRAKVPIVIIERPTVDYPVVCRDYQQLDSALTTYMK